MHLYVVALWTMLKARWEVLRREPEAGYSTETVLVTAGASAPEDVVAACVRYLHERFGADVESRTVREEHVSFPLPKGLRELTVV